MNVSVMTPVTCSADGKTTLHALGSLEARGSLFTAPATEVYQGMVSCQNMDVYLHLLSTFRKDCCI